MIDPHDDNLPQYGRRDWLYARAVWVPTLGYNMLLGRVLRLRNWWDFVDDSVIIGALPMAWDVKRLKKLGVTGVVNTCEEYGGPVKRYRLAGIEQLRVPTVDFTHPTLESVMAGVDFIERHVKAGGKVYVHCKAGRGRSATIVMGYLMQHHGMTPEEAQQRLLEARFHVNRRLATRPVVLAYYRQLQRDAAEEVKAAQAAGEAPHIMTSHDVASPELPGDDVDEASGSP